MIRDTPVLQGARGARRGRHIQPLAASELPVATWQLVRALASGA